MRTVFFLFSVYALGLLAEASSTAIEKQKQTLSECKLPAADSSEGSTPPQVIGKITKIDLKNDIKKLAVQPMDVSKKSEMISVNPKKTRLWTVYGGIASHAQLAVGEKIEVWFEDCKIKKESSANEAILIRVYSIDPNDSINK